MIIRTRSRFPLNGEPTVTATVTVAGVRHTERGPAGAGYPAHEQVARALAARLGLAPFNDACGIVPHGYRFRTTTQETTVNPTDPYGLDIARTRAALEAAGLRATYYGDGVFGCGDTAADHPSTEVAYGEVRLVVQPEYRMFDATTTVSVVWYDDESNVVDADDGVEFVPADLDGIVARVRALVGGAA